MPSSFLSDFSVIRPSFAQDQESILHWLVKAHMHSEWKMNSLSEEEKQNFGRKIKEDLFKLGLGKGKIEQRGMQLDDFLHDDWDAMQIFNLNQNPRGFGLKEKSKLFLEETSKIMESFYREETSLPPHLVHVSCTGYASPSAAQKIVSQKNSQRTHVTHAYHMGCYAALPAIRIASGFLAQDPMQQVDIVHTEICSLHMNPSLHSKDQLVIQSLFADGFIKYSVKNALAEKPGFKILSSLEEIIPNSTQSMVWVCEDWGFCMTIAKEVPFLIAKQISRFVQKLAELANIPYEHLLAKAIFAIHPGGPKIIEQVAESLQLTNMQIQESQEILRCYGNMSSATLPHIWEKILSNPLHSPGILVVSLAFGPGLTISGSIFEKSG